MLSIHPSTLQQRVDSVGQMISARGYGAVTQLSQRIGVCRQTLYNWAKRGREAIEHLFQPALPTLGMVQMPFTVEQSKRLISCLKLGLSTVQLSTLTTRVLNHPLAEFADLDAKVIRVFRKNMIYRRSWIATMDDSDLEQLPWVGPIIFKQIRQHIPFVGRPQPEQSEEEIEPCPSCHGTGLKLNHAALRLIKRQKSDYQPEKRIKAKTALEPPSVEASLLRLTEALERINSRLTVLERDRKQGLTTPRILLSIEEAAKALGATPEFILSQINDGSINFVRLTNGVQMIRTDALQEWLRWVETHIEPEPEPYVIPPEQLCGRCGERPYVYRRGETKLCRECQQQIKQERIQEKEKKRSERQSRRQGTSQTSSEPNA